jgi:pentatricopeptide repeat protein
MMSENKKLTTPLVSVIMVTRNRASLIGRAINSVLAQTYQNIELIIFDGASTDNTTEVVMSFEDSRIIYKSLQENISVPETIWMAFETSKGEYIAFLDDDDEYLPTKIEKEVSLFESLDDSYGLVYCWFRRFDIRTGRVFKEHKTELRGDVHVEVVSDPVVSGTPIIMLRRSVFKEMRGWRNDMGIVSDWEFCARVCQKYRVDYVPEILVNCYEHHGVHQMTFDKDYYKSKDEKLVKFHTMFLDEFKEVFEKHPIRKEPHYNALIISYLRLREWKKALSIYISLNKIRLSFNNTIKPLKYIIKSK